MSDVLSYNTDSYLLPHIPARELWLLSTLSCDNLKAADLVIHRIYQQILDHSLIIHEADALILSATMSTQNS